MPSLGKSIGPQADASPREIAAAWSRKWPRRCLGSATSASAPFLRDLRRLYIRFYKGSKKGFLQVRLLGVRASWFDGFGA